MDTIQGDIHYPTGNFALRSDFKHPNQAIFDLYYISTSTKGNMGSQHITANSMSVMANILYNPDEKNSLLQWVPTGHIAMNDAHLKVNGVNADIRIPLVDFDFSKDSIQFGKLRYWLIIQILI